MLKYILFGAAVATLSLPACFLTNAIGNAQISGCVANPSQGIFCPIAGAAQGSPNGSCYVNNTCDGAADEVVCAGGTCETCGHVGEPCCDVVNTNDVNAGDCPNATGAVCQHDFEFPLCEGGTNNTGGGGGSCTGTEPIVDGQCLAGQSGGGKNLFYVDTVDPPNKCPREVHTIQAATLADAQNAADTAFASFKAASLLGPVSQNEPDAEPKEVAMCPSGDPCWNGTPTYFYVTADAQITACKMALDNTCTWTPEPSGTTMCPAM